MCPRKKAVTLENEVSADGLRGSGRIEALEGGEKHCEKNGVSCSRVQGSWAHSEQGGMPWDQAGRLGGFFILISAGFFVYLFLIGGKLLYNVLGFCHTTTRISH